MRLKSDLEGLENEFTRASARFDELIHYVDSCIVHLNEDPEQLWEKFLYAQKYFIGGSSSNLNGAKFEETVMENSGEWILNAHRHSITEKVVKYLQSDGVPQEISNDFKEPSDNWEWRVVPSVALTLEVRSPAHAKNKKPTRKKEAECDAIITVNGYVCAFVECKTHQDALSDAVYQIMRAMWMAGSVDQPERERLKEFFTAEWGGSDSTEVMGFQIYPYKATNEEPICDSAHCRLMPVMKTGIIFTGDEAPAFDVSPSNRQQVAFTLCGQDPGMMIDELVPLLKKGLAFTLGEWQASFEISHHEIDVL
jgi:hypothetical protein